MPEHRAKATSPPDDLRGHEIVTNIKGMKTRIRRLEEAKRSLRERLQDKGEALKDALMEAETAQTALLRVEDCAAQLATAREEIEDTKATIEDLKVEAAKYRRWWLTEYHSLKVVADLLHNRDEVQDIISSSHERFLTYSA